MGRKNKFGIKGNYVVVDTNGNVVTSQEGYKYLNRKSAIEMADCLKHETGKNFFIRDADNQLQNRKR